MVPITAVELVLRFPEHQDLTRTDARLMRVWAAVTASSPIVSIAGRAGNLPGAFSLRARRKPSGPPTEWSQSAPLPEAPTLPVVIWQQSTAGQLDAS